MLFGLSGNDIAEFGIRRFAEDFGHRNLRSLECDTIIFVGDAKDFRKLAGRGHISAEMIDCTGQTRGRNTVVGKVRDVHVLSSRCWG